jgi:thiol-disulfide isomerase/thioredoxin
MHLKTKTIRLVHPICAAVLAAGALLAAPVATAFDLTDADGTRHRLADYRGRPVVVNFWATWCAPCIKEIPEIAEFAREQPARGAVVIGIALDIDDAQKTRDFAKKTGHDYPLVLGDAKVEKQFGKVKGLPTTLVFDAAGKRVYDHTGTVTRKVLEGVVSGSARTGR